MDPNVALEQARLSSSEIDAFLSGDIKRVLDSPSLDSGAQGQRQSRQGDQVGAAAARASDGHGDDRRHRSPDRRATSRPICVVRSNTIDVGRERELEPGRARASDVRVVLRPRPRDHAAVGRSDSRGVHRAVGQGGRSAPRARNGAALDSQAALRMADVDPQAIGADFDGNGTFEFGEPRKFVIHNRSHRLRARRRGAR